MAILTPTQQSALEQAQRDIEDKYLYRMLTPDLVTCMQQELERVIVAFQIPSELVCLTVNDDHINPSHFINFRDRLYSKLLHHYRAW